MGKQFNASILKQVYNPYSPYMPAKERYDIQQSPDINASISPIEREDANLEAEKGEVVLKPDLSGIFHVRGKKHSQGGTPLNLDQGSFIFSDDPKLHINDHEKKMFEFKKGGFVSKRLNTPARIIKREVPLQKYNSSSDIIKNQDNRNDKIAQNSAALMLGKYQEKIGQVAYVQEAKKGFPTGIPDFSHNTAPIYDPKTKAEVEQNPQYMQQGGFSNPYTPKMMTYQQGGYNQLFYNQPDQAPFPGLNRQPGAPGYPPVSYTPSNPELNSNPLRANGFNPGTTLPYNPSIPLSPLQKANVLYSGYQALTIPRFNPQRSQVNSPLVELNKYNPSTALSSIDNSAATAYQANRLQNPYLAGANNEAIFGQSLNAKQQVLGDYANRNTQVGNEQALTNNQIQRQDNQYNTGANAHYYDQTQALAQNYTNEKRAATNQTVSLTNNYLSQNQALEQSLASQRTYGRVQIGMNPNGTPIYQAKPLFDVDNTGFSPKVYYTGAGSLNNIPYQSNRLYDLQAFGDELKRLGVDPNSAAAPRYLAILKGQPLQQSYGYQPTGSPYGYKQGGFTQRRKAALGNPYF